MTLPDDDKRYEIVESIGRGGMATVYRAVDRNAEMDVAIKVLHEYLIDDEGIVEAFEREASLMRRIDHPGVVRVFESSTIDDRPAFAMEFCEGGDLVDLLARRGTMDESEALEVMIPVLEALQAIHDEGVIHRDIKPHNIVFDADGNPKLIDFGIGQAEELLATDESGQLGTVEYMAPERVDGLALDARSDLYSAAIVLFELLCGHPPYRADSAAAVFRMHREAEVADPRALGAPVGDEVATALMRAMAKHPGHRFDGVHQFILALTGESTPRRDIDKHSAWRATREQIATDTRLAAPLESEGYEWVVYVPREATEFGTSQGDLSGVWDVVDEFDRYSLVANHNWRAFSRDGTRENATENLVRNLGIARGLSRDGVDVIVERLREAGVPARYGRRPRKRRRPPRLTPLQSLHAAKTIKAVGISAVIIAAILLGFSWELTEGANEFRRADFHPALQWSMLFGTAALLGMAVGRMWLPKTYAEWWLARMSKRYVLDFCLDRRESTSTGVDRRYVERFDDIQSPRVATSYERAINMVLHLGDADALRYPQIDEGSAARIQSGLARIAEEIYELAGRIVDLESHVAAIRPGRLVSQIRQLDRHIATEDDVAAVEELIEEKAELRRQLEARDDACLHLETLAQRLLRAAGELEGMVHRTGDADGGEETSMEVIDEWTILDFEDVNPSGPNRPGSPARVHLSAGG